MKLFGFTCENGLLSKLFLCITVTIVCTYSSFAQKVDHYRNHFLIAVDQSSDFQSLTLDPVYRELCSVLDTMDFKTDVDQISLFAFSLPGLHSSATPFSDVFSADRVSFTERLAKNLVVSRTDFVSSGKDFESYKSENILSLFNGTDQYAKLFRNYSGVTLSHYVFPCLLMNVDKSVPAEKYYAFVISDFGTGMSGPVTPSGDFRRLNELAHNESVARECDSTFSYVSRYLYSTSVPIHKQVICNGRTIHITCQQVIPRQLFGKSANLSSNLSVHQKKYKGVDFILDAASLTFPQSSPVIVDSILMKFWHESDFGRIKIYPNYPGSAYDAVQQSFFLPEQNLKLAGVDENDKIKFEYTVYVSSEDDNSILPFAFIQNRDYTVNHSDLVANPRGKNLMIGIIILIVLVLIGLLLWLIWRVRGRKRKIAIDLRITPISSSRFMEVKDKKVIDYDCWYFRSSQTTRKIVVRGNLVLERKKFAQPQKYDMDYMVEDIDHLPEFSFRPDGVRPDGSLKSCNEKYDLDFNENDRSFSFVIDAYLVPDMSPNFSTDNIAELKITVTAKNKNSFISASNSLRYSFIIKPFIDKSDLWMAFDPGTTGSCVAFAYGGQPSDSNNIYLALNRQEHVKGTDAGGDTEYSPIFQSKLKIPNSSRLFKDIDIEECQEGSGKDFYFGTKATQMAWGKNSFQSIKKLLGYSTPLTISNETNHYLRQLQGKDLAHLLVRGLYSQVTDYIKDTDTNIDSAVRSAFVSEEGEFTPSRAVVAVPNNYTMVKIQEMVDTIVRLHSFKEVHYLYEAEAVFMNYLKSNWSNIPSISSNKVFLVYDMGGATINATAFRINDVQKTYTGEDIESFEVQTLSRIGYSVGGDDIDFALIKTIYGMHSIDNSFRLAFPAASEKELMKHKYNHMVLNKFKMIEIARKIKTDYVDTKMGKAAKGNITEKFDDFWMYVVESFNKIPANESQKIQIKADDMDALDLDRQYILDQLKTHSIMDKYVFSNIRDAVTELLKGLTPKEFSEIELISSGRSILFPGVLENVKRAICEADFKLTEWKGFCDENGLPDDDKVKTAVATGACWYALFRNRIKMQHNIVTSSFGFIDTVDLKQQFVPIIKKNDRFDISGRITKNLGHPATCQEVVFVQMLGSNFSEIYQNGEIVIRHKMNILDVVHSGDIPAPIDDIEVSLDDKGNFGYVISSANGTWKVTEDDNSESRLGSNSVITEIADENSEAYIYAAVAAKPTMLTPASDSNTEVTTRF